MGNICGKAEPDNFSQPGRVLGTAPPQGPKTAPVPRKVGGPPRTLGASSTSPRPAGTGPEANDARQKAADAAEARAKASSSKPLRGLKAELEAKKKEGRADTFKREREREQRFAEIDSAREASWNR